MNKNAITTVSALFAVMLMACSSSVESELPSTSDSLVAVIPPPKPVNRLQCASISIGACVGSALGGLCAWPDGTPGTCQSFQSPPQYVVLPPPGVSGYDCNICAPLVPPPGGGETAAVTTTDGNEGGSSGGGGEGFWSGLCDPPCGAGSCCQGTQAAPVCVEGCTN